MFRLGRPATHLALPVLACLAWGRPAPDPSPPRATSSAAAHLTLQATLYQGDFLRRTVSLATGDYGLAIENHQVINIDSELDFGSYYPDQLLAGVQGSQVGGMYDLGTSQDLALRYGYQETVGGGQGFASIHFENGQLVILEDYDLQTFQPFTEGARFYRAYRPAYSEPTDVEVGHIYLVVIHDLLDPTFLRFAKLIVTSHHEDDQVTVAWEEILP